MKIKPLNTQQIVISIDRLTRFKDPETKYLRVFKEIILSNLIEPKFKKSELDVMDYEELTNYAEMIINSSLADVQNELIINQRLYDYEKSLFVINENTEKLLKNKINYNAVLQILPNDVPHNLQKLKNFDKFPAIKKVLLCEGITEEILLPVFGKICGFDFKENGIHIISAGGKNQVVKYFYNFANSLKIPIFVLLDSDAVENLKEIQPRLRKYDKIHLVKSGEFEDLLPNSLIIKTLNYATKNISLAPIDGLEESVSKVEFLEEFFRHRGLHEFKKADFAQDVKANISSREDISPEIKEIIKELTNTHIVHGH